MKDRNIRERRTGNKFAAFRFRLMVAWKIMFNRGFIACADEATIYMKGISMNQAIDFHNRFVTFLQTTLDLAAEQEMAIKATEEIISNKTNK